MSHWYRTDKAPALFLTDQRLTAIVATMSSERSELRGQVLDARYRIGGCIGVGGTGVVFDARDLKTRERVVIKTLRPVFLDHPDLIRRMRREAEIARTVPHAGVVPVLQQGELSDGSPYMVMEWMRGESMSRLIRRTGRLGVGETCVVAERVANILHVAHTHGYVHRDVKPDHILLDRTSAGNLRVVLLDWGVCAAVSAPSAERERERGRVFGTPSYVSPEQALGEPYVDGRADVYGLGVVMFEALTGRLPFSASNVANLLRRIIREDPPEIDLIAPHVGPALAAVVNRALRRQADERYPNARAMARAVHPFVADHLGVERDLASRLVIGDDSADLAETAPGIAAA